MMDFSFNIFSCCHNFVKFVYQKHITSISLLQSTFECSSSLPQSMNDPQGLRSRILRYVAPVLVVSVIFNFTKFLEATVDRVVDDYDDVINGTDYGDGGGEEYYELSGEETVNGVVKQCCYEY